MTYIAASNIISSRIVDTDHDTGHEVGAKFSLASRITNDGDISGLQGDGQGTATYRSTT
jgi:hypothetical protein